MSTAEVAKKLVEMCRAGQFEEAYPTLFSADARSIEGTGETAEGLEAVQAKGEKFGEAWEINEFAASDPYVGTDTFAVHFTVTMTEKATGNKMTMEEIGVYKVSDGKVTEERFLYGGQP